MQLTEHFSLAELTFSPTALRKGLDNTPTPAVIKALINLAINILEPVRAHFDLPVRITSGYRSPLVNKAVGGAPSSQHQRGEAADFTVPGHRNIDVAQWIQRNLKFDQLIYEFGEDGWVHCSWALTPLRHSELTARRVAGHTKYLPGLIV